MPRKNPPSKTYTCWINMRQRCLNKNNSKYPIYGGRGIKVCKRWDSFANFKADMGDPPPGCSLERIDTNGDYSKSNCRWATQLDQQNNRRDNRRFELNGQNLTLCQWAKLLGTDHKTISDRIARGWPIERAILERPVIGRNQYSTRS